MSRVMHFEYDTSGTMILASTMDRMSWKATFWKLEATSMMLAVRRPSKDLMSVGRVEWIGGQRVERT
jgi:hypothetical protein